MNICKSWWIALPKRDGDDIKFRIEGEQKTPDVLHAGVFHFYIGTIT